MTTSTTEQVRYTHISHKEVEDMCKELYGKMLADGYGPDCLVGLLRGGVVPARYFADYFNIIMDFFALGANLYEDIGKQKKEVSIAPFHGDISGKKALVVDDIWDTGRTMSAVLDYFKGQNVKTVTLFRKEGSAGEPDYWAEEAGIDEWIVFPWEERETRQLRGYIGEPPSEGESRVNFTRILKDVSINGKIDAVEEQGFEISGGETVNSTMWNFKNVDLIVDPDRDYDVEILFDGADDFCDILFDKFVLGYVDKDQVKVIEGHNPFNM